MAITNHVSIRSIRQDDSVPLRACADDPKVARTSGIPHPYPTGAADQWIRNTLQRVEDSTEQAYAIIYRDEFVGVVALRKIGIPKKTATLEYFVKSQLWNKGIATTASAFAIEKAFKTLRIHVILASTLTKNPSSMRVLEKLCFSKIGYHTTPISEEDKFSGEKWIDWELERNRWNPCFQKICAD